MEAAGEKAICENESRGQAGITDAPRKETRVAAHVIANAMSVLAAASRLPKVVHHGGEISTIVNRVLAAETEGREGGSC